MVFVLAVLQLHIQLRCEHSIDMVQELEGVSTIVNVAEFLLKC